MVVPAPVLQGAGLSHTKAGKTAASLLIIGKQPSPFCGGKADRTPKKPRPYFRKRHNTVPFPRFELASAENAETIVAIEKQVAELKTYGQPLSLDAALKQVRTSQFYLIWMGDVTIGTAAIRVRSDESVYFSNLAILPAYRGMGLGRAAMSFLLAKADKATRIDLVTHPENTAALHLYISLGFEVEARKEDYFGDGEPRLVLAKTRNPN